MLRWDITFLARSRSEKRHKAMTHTRPSLAALGVVFFHPDFLAARELPTVGSGIGPDLLTWAGAERFAPAMWRKRTTIADPALAGSCAISASTAGGESHPALKTFMDAGGPAQAF